MEKLIGGKVLLRDMVEKDIDDYIRWNTIETEWLLWDAPWEDEEEFDHEMYRQKKLAKLARSKNRNKVRSGFEICVRDENETHIGWVNSYFIDDAYNYTDEKMLTAIGINIPEQWVRCRGCGTEAWALFIDYLKTNGIIDIYTQTWSGNYRVIGLIKKTGFEECSRNIGIREVRGKIYDGLTFKLGK